MTDLKKTQSNQASTQRKSDADKVKNPVMVRVTDEELKAIDERIKVFTGSRSSVVRHAAIGVDPPLLKKVDPHGGIERVMSLADKEDYKTFKRAASNLNEASRRLNILIKQLKEAGLDDVKMARIEAMQKTADELTEQAQTMTQTARRMVQMISKGPS